MRIPWKNNFKFNEYCTMTNYDFNLYANNQLEDDVNTIIKQTIFTPNNLVLKNIFDNKDIQIFYLETFSNNIISNLFKNYFNPKYYKGDLKLPFNLNDKGYQLLMKILTKTIKQASQNYINRFLPSFVKLYDFINQLNLKDNESVLKAFSDYTTSHDINLDAKSYNNINNIISYNQIKDAIAFDKEKITINNLDNINTAENNLTQDGNVVNNQNWLSVYQMLNTIAINTYEFFKYTFDFLKPAGVSLGVWE